MRATVTALMVVIWLGLVAYGAQQLGDGIGQAMNGAADRIERRGN